MCPKPVGQDLHQRPTDLNLKVSSFYSSSVSGKKPKYSLMFASFWPITHALCRLTSICRNSLRTCTNNSPFLVSVRCVSAIAIIFESKSPLPEWRHTLLRHCRRRVQQGDTLDPYLFIICLDYVLRTSIDTVKDNGFNLAKERRRKPAQTITDANYTDDIALLANIRAKP